MDYTAAGRYGEACRFLPGRLRAAALSIGRGDMARAEELRLRIGRPLTLTVPEGAMPLPHTAVLREEVEQVLERVTEYSLYTASETLRQGFVTAAGGFRVGVCGTALPEGEENRGMKDVSSLAIRIPRLCRNIALPVLPGLWEEGRLCGTVILSPPGGGKTTFLRDLVRLLSDGSRFSPPLRVALADERGEVAAMHRGVPQLDVGGNTDVLDGCPKAAAAGIFLRTMSPQVLALDEIAGKKDADAVCAAVNCGVAILATAHAADLRELRARAAMRELLACGVFRRAVIIRGRGAQRTYETEEL